MSHILTIDGKEYMPATIAGRHLGYTKDYILMLIKGGKVEGQKVGHKWFVHLPSAEAYFVTAKQEQEIRRKHLSEVRKAELRQHVQTPIQQQSRSEESDTETYAIPPGFSAHAKVALLETLVIVFLGVSVGSLGYVGTSVQSASAHDGGFVLFKNIAISVYEFFTPTNESETRSVIVQHSDTPLDTIESLGVSTSVSTTTHTSLVVAPDEVFTATTIESVQESFSDEVEVSVDPENPNTGIITPRFKEGDGEQYRFLMVPTELNDATE